jgi:ribosomal protein S18 acetylase RimI-like enzyme
MAVGPSVVKSSPHDAERLACPLAGAFFDDPVFCWIAPDDDRRRTMLEPFFKLYAETIAAHEESYSTVDGLAAALWVPPGRLPIPEGIAEAFGERLAQIAGADAERLFEVAALIDEHHREGAYYYLQFIGVVPGQQGKGIGSALLSHMLDRCDREGVATYLDATSPSNRALYERHGFRVIDEFSPVAGPPLWPMWREPSARLNSGYGE